MNQAQASQQLQQAITALQQGRAQEARSLFNTVVQQVPQAAQAWLGLAFSCSNLGDTEAAMAAIERCLKLEPRNIRALLFKAEHLDGAGQSRKALSFFEAALGLAANIQEPLPADIQKGLQRAQQLSDKFSAEYGDFLLSKLKEKGYQADQASDRFNLSLDICLGRKQIYHQQPNRFYFPGLPQRQFYERSEFEWIEQLEAQTDSIRTELQALLETPERFAPYLQSDADIPEINESGKDIINNPDWGALYLWEYGQQVAENARACPQTMAAMEQVPLPHVTSQTPIVLFSRLAANTHIPPHHGMLNTRLICHLPLIVPENCGALRCGSEQREWVEGQTLIFDDSIEHEAWNNSDQDRVVLLFDIWRPELTQDERALVCMMLESVKEYQGSE
ncbi:aspartyl/asparaginyl beta-hydroxylase domain-containing protein [Lacimicrobium alkaliphilum]|uniref:Aspartyl beta-hydroxylase n=1 Tax=Lacimicrobium alkaliphilum TaxID=1526571 RepID=A0A0U3A8J4_9ALTE|nr:aspartyl/asparaginyl beta-hydroxylase domain-containing protein [Lacimicrobium alkaliphilum]ALS97342.1 aspartyl beta-hydroxylase [Lacimicrobium alkaliphilum]